MSFGWNWPYPYPCSPQEICEILQRLEAAEKTISKLTERLDQLERLSEEMRAKPPLHIEYHFDQLKVNELKGTLNVGLSPQGVQGIDSFETPFAPWSIASGPGGAGTGTIEPITPLQQQMETYLDREGPALLAGLEGENSIALDDKHRMRLLADVRSQLKDRVHYYAKTTPYPAAGSENDRQAWSRSVQERTFRDVRAALTAYLQGWKINSQNEGENRNGG